MLCTCVICCGTFLCRDIVYAVAINGKLLQFPLPEFQDGESSIYCGISPQMAGEKVKNYLSEIETLSTELAKVHSTIETEDKILKELNIIIHIACQMNEGSTSNANVYFQVTLSLPSSLLIRMAGSETLVFKKTR